MIKRLIRKSLHLLGYRIVREANFPHATDPCHDLRMFPGFGPVRTVVDVGGNTGQSVERFLREFPESRIISCEPAPAAFAVLREKYANDSRVRCVNVALGALPGEAAMEIVTPDSQMNAIIRGSDSPVRADSSRVTVKMDTLDSLLDKFEFPSVDLLKIDTEGFEIDVLIGGDDALKSGKVGAVLAECAFQRDDAQHTHFLDLFARLDERGFLFMGLYDVAHWAGYLHYCNALFVKRPQPGARPRGA